jgi:hypothetical protein
MTTDKEKVHSIIFKCIPKFILFISIFTLLILSTIGLTTLGSGIVYEAITEKGKVLKLIKDPKITYSIGKILIIIGSIISIASSFFISMFIGIYYIIFFIKKIWKQNQDSCFLEQKQQLLI